MQLPQRNTARCKGFKDVSALKRSLSKDSRPQQEQMARPGSKKTISKANFLIQTMLQLLLFHKSQQEVLRKRPQLNPAKILHAAYETTAAKKNQQLNS